MKGAATNLPVHQHDAGGDGRGAHQLAGDGPWDKLRLALLLGDANEAARDKRKNQGALSSEGRKQKEIEKKKKKKEKEEKKRELHRGKTMTARAEKIQVRTTRVRVSSRKTTDRSYSTARKKYRQARVFSSSRYRKICQKLASRMDCLKACPKLCPWSAALWQVLFMQAPCQTGQRQKQRVRSVCL